jgi:hypothetical protein
MRMSDLDLRQFHTFLEDLIEQSSRGGVFSINKTIETLVTKHPRQLDKIQDHITELGLRALIRNNCRAKKSVSNSPDMFGRYRLGKLIAVPTHDANGKFQWDKKRRSEMSFDDLDGIRSRFTDRPTKLSRERQDYDEIEKRTRPYRAVAGNVSEALEMAERDGR